jgi:hypothetical protein
MPEKRKSIKPLHLEAFVHFLDFVRPSKDIHAVEDICQKLEQGKTLDEIVKKREGPEFVFFANPDPYIIEVSKKEGRTYHIKVGYFPGPTCGDMGGWTVGFDKGWEVLRVDIISRLVS